MQVRINKASRYAPIRYEATRPYAVRLGQAYYAACLRGEHARLSFVHNQLLDLLRNAVAKVGTERGPGPVQAEMVNIQVFGHFLQAGKVIFDIDPVLSAALHHTDAKDIPCGELPLPCDALYLHFGGATEVEGAFVTRSEATKVSIDLVLPGWGTAHFLLTQTGEALLPLKVDSNDPDKPIQLAMAETMREIAQRNALAREKMQEIERQLEQQYGQIVKVPNPMAYLEGKDELMQRSLDLVVNTLFYLSAEAQDVIEDWGNDTPDTARAALSTAPSAGHLKTLTNTLTKAGYRRVKFVGRQFAHSIADHQLGDAISTGRTLATHFRRGHFKHQPHGPGRSLRKHIFIAPVVVNADKGGDVQGRIYDVQDVRSRAHNIQSSNHPSTEQAP